MDVRAYIESGIIETYVLGQANDQEQREIQCLSKIYPEIGNYLREAEERMGMYAEQFEKAPPVGLKTSILSAIEEVDQEPADTESKQIPTAASNPTEEQAPKVIRMNAAQRYLSAAAIVLAIVFGGLLAVQFNNTTALQKQVETLANENAETQNNLKTAEEYLAIMSNPANEVIQLKGTAKYPDAKATVYWDKENGEVYLQPQELAALPADKDYQLWILVDGVPQDMGTMEATSGSLLAKMKIAKEGQLFAITIEPKGGSKNPTLEEMVVAGAVPA